MDKLLKTNLQYFAKDEELGKDPSGADEIVETDDQEDKTDKSEKTFTQEQVNGIVTKESRSAIEKTLKELGFDDFENAKDGVEAYKEWQKSQMSEQERIASELEEIKTEKTTVESQLADLQAENTALKVGVIADSVEDVVALAKVKVSDEKDIETAIKEVVEKYPNFLAVQEEEEKPKKPRIVNPANPNGASTDDDPLDDILAKYQ